MKDGPIAVSCLNANALAAPAQRVERPFLPIQEIFKLQQKADTLTQGQTKGELVIQIFSKSLIASALLFVSPAAAGVILSNEMASPYLSDGTLFSNQSSLKGIGAEIPRGADYRFDSFRVVLEGGLGGAPQAVARIFSNDGSLVPAAELQSLGSLPVAFGHETYDFTSPVPFTLKAGTKYWFVISHGPAAGVFRWDRAFPTYAPIGTVNYLGYNFSANSGATWGSSSVFNSLELNATAIPETSVLAVAGPGIAGLLCFGRPRTSAC